MTEADIAESVIDRLLLALAAQLAQSQESVLAVGAAEALADLSRAEAEHIFGQAGHLVHYGAGTAPLQALIDAISGVLRAEAPEDAPFKPGDKVRLVGALPESLAEYDEMSLRRVDFTVRYVGRGPTIDVQSESAEDYMIATVSADAVEHLQS